MYLVNSIQFVFMLCVRVCVCLFFDDLISIDDTFNDCSSVVVVSVIVSCGIRDTVYSIRVIAL